MERKDTAIRLVQVPFADLVFMDGLDGRKKNPRKIEQAELEKLAASIESDPTFLENRPPLVSLSDGKYFVYAGHQRARACGEVLGWQKVPCLVEKDVPTATMERRAIQDNTHAGEWDFSAGDWDLADVADWGVPVGSWGEKAKAEEDGFEPPEIETVQTDIVLGDILEIGPHRLICGDCRDAETVGVLMAGHLADLYITDPPYGVAYAEKNRFLNAIYPGNRIQEPIEGDNLSSENCGELWRNAFRVAEKAMSGKASYYVFSAQGQDLMMMMMMMIDDVFSLKHCLVWVKNNHVLGRSDYNYKHEPILYGWKKKGTHEFHGGFQTSVLEFPKPQKSDLHPTMKPVALIGRLIENSTAIEASVLDSFLGSGTTMVAAHQLNRRCFGMEISPQYCQVIMDRMRRLDPEITVKKNGQIFN